MALIKLKRRESEAVVTDDAEDEDKGGIGEVFSTVFWALGIAFVLRTFIFQPFTIPSASMYPGLMEGDYVITSKYSVGYGKFAAAPFPFFDVDGRLFGRGPDRGDVVVFRPEGAPQNYIKRVIGLPGDQVQMIDGILHINGTAAPTEFVREEDYRYIANGEYRQTYTATLQRETLPEGDSHFIYDVRKNNSSDNTGVFTVAPGEYFMLGDNRDFSGDSRVRVSNMGAGLVPAENIIGRAEFILLSVDEDFALFKPWTWGNMRGSRFFKRVE